MFGRTRVSRNVCGLKECVVCIVCTFRIVFGVCVELRSCILCVYEGVE